MRCGIGMTTGNCRLGALLELRVEVRSRVDDARTSTTGVSTGGLAPSSAGHKNYVLTRQCYLPLDLETQLQRTFVSHLPSSCLQAQSSNMASSLCPRVQKLLLSRFRVFSLRAFQATGSTSDLLRLQTGVDLPSHADRVHCIQTAFAIVASAACLQGSRGQHSTVRFCSAPSSSSAAPGR